MQTRSQYDALIRRKQLLEQQLTDVNDQLQQPIEPEQERPRDLDAGVPGWFAWLLMLLLVAILSVFLWQFTTNADFRDDFANFKIGSIE